LFEKRVYRIKKNPFLGHQISKADLGQIEKRLLSLKQVRGRKILDEFSQELCNKLLQGI
jgi:hypothetical protein